MRADKIDSFRLVHPPTSFLKEADDFRLNSSFADFPSFFFGYVMRF